MWYGRIIGNIQTFLYVVCFVCAFRITLESVLVLYYLANIQFNLFSSISFSLICSHTSTKKTPTTYTNKYQEINNKPKESLQHLLTTRTNHHTTKLTQWKKNRKKQTSKYAFKSIIINEWYQVFPKRFCKAYLPLIPVFDLGAQLDSIAKFVPQS